MHSQKHYQKFAEIYDEIMNVKFYNSYAEFIFRILHKFKIKPTTILDLACGTGRLAKIISLKGYNLEGIDSSMGMINIAKKRGVKCYKKNIINFKLPKKYDLILCTYDSLNYITNLRDLKKCLSSVKRHLRVGGVFIFDMNSDFKINKLIIPSTRYFKIKNIELIWLNLKKPNTWIAEMVLFVKKRVGYQRYFERHTEKAYGLKSIKKLLSQLNFKTLGIYSDFKFSKVKNNSPRWFFVSKI